MAVEEMLFCTTTTYAVEFSHSRNEGIVASPVAGEEQNVSLARLHSPIEYLTVYWTATREGSPPILPSHLSYNANDNRNRVFLGGERHGIVTPTLAGHIWQACGHYRYVIVGPESLDSDFPLSMMPWEHKPEDFYVPSSNFVTSIINTSPVAQLKKTDGTSVTFADNSATVDAIGDLLR